MLQNYQSGAYSIHNPYVAVDPYGISPLSAVALFSTSKPATISIEVEGKNGAKPVTQQFETVTTQHQIPIYGLYAGESTQVTLTAYYTDGTSEAQILSLTGYGLPSDFVPVSVVPEDTDTTEMANGWTFLMAGSLQGYVYAIDEVGSVRWMFSEKGLGAASVFLPLDNGNYLIGGDKSFGNYYKYSVFELDLTGRIVHEYLVNGYHHDAVELPSGNLLICANNLNGQVMEDTIYEMDRETGDILRTWDFNSYFDVGNYNEEGQHIADVNYGTGASDWLHINGIDYNEQTDSLLISSRHQDAVFSMNLSTGEIDWIISDPNDQWPEYLADKLLTPVGDGFEWQYGQHNAIWLPNGDVMLFDNGDYRSKTPENILDAATESYSRAVIYHVDAQAKTISQVWEFGKDKGPDHFAVNVSSVQYLGENHYLIDFGGIVKNSAGEATYGIMDGITGSSRSEVYEIKDGAVVFHANVNRSGLHGNTFRAVRLDPYASVEELDLTIEASRLGSLYSYGLATPVDFQSTDAVSDGPDVSITDNGAQLLINVTLENQANDIALIFDGSLADYRVTLPSGSSISYTLNKSEIPVGTYHLYLSNDGVIYDLALMWNNDMDARPYPDSYAITVTTRNEDNGSVYGSGTYYANTPFTVWVKPADDVKFVGWYSNGTLLSTETSYSLTATEDMTLTATFEGDTISGGGGGSGGGGAAVEEDSAITLPDSGQNGSVTASPSNPKSGEDVVLTVKPDSGYKLDALKVIDAQGNEIALTDKGDGKYVFTMPDSHVTVTATFIKADSETEPVGPFTDVNTDDWFAEAVQYVLDNEIMNGTSATTFGPNTTTTRGMIVTILYRLEGEPDAAASSFTDVASNMYYADAINWAAANGIVNGVSEISFAPDNQITREQMAAILYRYAQFKGYDVTASNDLSSYTDASQISEYATTAMQWANAEELITGRTSTTLAPQGTATRAEVATILMRFCENIAG